MQRLPTARWLRRPTGLGLCLALAVACGDDAPVRAVEVTPLAQQQPTEVPQGEQPDAEAAKAPVYQYSQVGKRDPFRSYLAEVSRDVKERERQLSPTELYELDQYKLTALLTKVSRPKAMLEDPTGMGHVVTVGARLGRNGGRIVRITGRTLVVREEFVDATGTTQRVDTTLELPSDELQRKVQ